MRAQFSQFTSGIRRDGVVYSGSAAAVGRSDTADDDETADADSGNTKDPTHAADDATSSARSPAQQQKELSPKVMKGLQRIRALDEKLAQLEQVCLKQQFPLRSSDPCASDVEAVAIAQHC